MRGANQVPPPLALPDPLGKSFAVPFGLRLGTKRGKVTRKEVFAAAKALEEEGLVIVRGDVVNYIGSSWRDVCKRREGHE